MVGELARDWGLWGELISYGTGGGGISEKRDFWKHLKRNLMLWIVQWVPQPMSSGEPDLVSPGEVTWNMECSHMEFFTSGPMLGGCDNESKSELAKWVS